MFLGKSYPRLNKSLMTVQNESALVVLPMHLIRAKSNEISVRAKTWGAPWTLSSIAINFSRASCSESLIFQKFPTRT